MGNRKRRLWVALLILTVALQGCASVRKLADELEDGINEIGRNDEAVWTALGAGLGLAVGSDDNRLLFAAGGALVGNAVGKSMAEKRKNYVTDREWAEAELAATDEAIEETRKRNVLVMQAIEKLEARVAVLREKKGRNQDVRDEAVKARQAIDGILRANCDRQEQLAEKIASLEETRSQLRANALGETTEVERRIEELKAAQTALERSTRELAKLKTAASAL